MMLTHGPVSAAAAFALGVLAISMPSAMAQNGLVGEYFDIPNLTGLVTTRVDPTVDFTTWGLSPDGTAVSPDGSYSERWTGFVFIDRSGQWSFTTESDDGVRLRVNDILIIDNWNNHAATTDVGQISLSPGWHPIQLEHYQVGGPVVIQLSFAGPGDPTTIIPTERLSVSATGNTPPIVDAGDDAVIQPDVTQYSVMGTASDLDGIIVDIDWDQVAGPPVSILGANQLSATMIGFSTIGVHRFRLTVTDDDGAQAFDDMTVTVTSTGSKGGVITGVNRVWQTLTIEFPSAVYIEGANPNPFLDRRLDVTFTHVASGQTLVVPGYFAADGDAANSGADTGSTWRVHFTAPRAGDWSYQASFLAGDGIVVDDSVVGTGLDFHDDQATISILPYDPAAPGFLGKGRLDYVDEHYLVHGQTQRPFFKVGTNSPENFLAYADFDQTPASHTYGPHVGDWQAGDPTWGGGLGKGIIGALNYLGSKGVNAVYFLTFNEEGDGDDVWVWTGEEQRMRFDCSKLDQWEIVFSHMDRLGIVLHVVTQEEENGDGPPGLDFGNLGDERKLYYRELIARFSHHLGLIWNLGEETGNSTSQLTSFHDYFRANDPYGHPVVVHTRPGVMEVIYDPLLAQDKLQGASLQVQDINNTYDRTLQWRSQSAAQGTPWVVSMDEHGPPNEGAVPDNNDPGHDELRRYGLWANMMAGGAGCEWYFGFSFPNNDLTCEDWRTRENLWDISRHAKEFFEQLSSPFHMDPADDLISNVNGRCFAWPGRDYAIFLAIGGTTTLDLEGSGRKYRVRWYDPRLGGELQVGSVETIQGPGVQDLGLPPYASFEDWAVRVELMPPTRIRERTNPNSSPGGTTPGGGGGG